MFGRRKEPRGRPPTTPSPGGGEPFPIGKMDAALDGAIRLFTKALDDAGVDAGALAIRGAAPANVSGALAECTTYRGEADDGLTYLVLGITADFRAFMYPPHCRLFFIINAAGICEDEHTQSFLKDLAPNQLPGPLLDAHLMRQWIGYILPTAEAMKAGQSALEALHRKLMGDLMAVLNRAPPEFVRKIDDKAVFREWVGGWPGAIGRPLTPDVERMNGLPVTPFIAEVLTTHLAELQMNGLRNR